MRNPDDTAPPRSRSGWIRLLASPYLTLVAVGVLILLSLTGALVPQQGIIEDSRMAEWRNTHPLVNRYFSPLGIFTIFQSPLFLLSIVVLFVNTLACTVQSAAGDKLFAGRDADSRCRWWGFNILHISLLVCMAGAFISAAFRMSGHIVLTEGQTFTDRHEAYSQLVEGPLRKDRHEAFQVELLEAEYVAATDWSTGTKAATLRMASRGSPAEQVPIAFNAPARFGRTTFTLQETGYSPQLFIRSEHRRIPPFNGFIALKVWGVNQEREHRDFLPLPNNDQRLVMTLYPAYELKERNPSTELKAPMNPALVVSLESPEGKLTEDQVIRQGQTVTVDDLEIRFGELRRWTSFLVVQDPGYGVVCTSFWMAIAALGLRYLPDIKEWIKEDRYDRTS